MGAHIPYIYQNEKVGDLVPFNTCWPRKFKLKRVFHSYSNDQGGRCATSESEFSAS